jgi:NAD(P)-dependent dehydrogenase (short-subunit alcohol dehydrogenase family)
MSSKAESSKVWFITGASKGFGRVWTEAALSRGDRVAAAARNIATLDQLAAQYPETLLTIRLDVGDKAAVDAAVDKAHARFGRLDIVVNNAGYGLFGTIEEVSEQEARAQIETNLFGALWVTKAALPFLLAQKSGHILQVSSIGGVAAFPTLGLYHASKWGLEGFRQALAGEVRGLGVKVTIIEPGGYSTDWRGPSAVRAEPLPAYDEVRAMVAKMAGSFASGDPEATGPAILKLVDAVEPPLRVFFGPVGLPMIRDEYARRTPPGNNGTNSPCRRKAIRKRPGRSPRSDRRQTRNGGWRGRHPQRPDRRCRAPLGRDDEISKVRV